LPVLKVELGRVMPGVGPQQHALEQ